MPQTTTLALIGPGRAGLTVALALAASGVRPVAVAGRSPDAASTREGARRLDAPVRPVDEVGRGADLLVVACPDGAIGAAADAAVDSLPPGSLVVHLSGSRGLDVFARAAHQRPDVRFAALHPLVSMPSPEVGRERLPGGWCAVAGDDDVYALARALELAPFAVSDADRARYHAAAVIAANHLVALLGQVERIATAAGIPFESFLPLAQGALDNVRALGVREALTGPVVRGDVATIDAHLAALPADERPAYRALASEALRVSGRADRALAIRLR